jgi:ring-1,2-phenylacetyl-CoA epoxidase subunit PaaD
LPSEVEVRAALREVIDPELGLDVVSLGMVGEVVVDGGAVAVDLRLTTMSCPFWNLFVDQVEAALFELEGVERVDVRFDRHRPWSPDRMSAQARRELESFGLLPPSVARPLKVLQGSRR